MFDKLFKLFNIQKEPILNENTKLIILDESRIIKDFRITDKWSKGFNRVIDDVEELVIHGTGGGISVKALLQWIINGERAKSYKQGIGLFPFAIDLDGTLYQLINNPGIHWFYHSNSHIHDKKTIGVELLNKSSQNANDYTDAQYETLYWLAFEYMPYYFKNYSRIVGHDYNYNKYAHNKKGCPGTGFDWSNLESKMLQKNIEFETEGFECYYNLQFPTIGENNG
jgi:hypothetical protein